MAFNTKELEPFIGKGITLPLKLTNGRVPLDTGFELIRASIRTILAWPVGTRFFLPEFGSRLEELLEEPNDDVLQSLVETLIVEALSKWERRVEILAADIVRPDDMKLAVQINYRVIATERTDTFIYPFYRQIIY